MSDSHDKALEDLLKETQAQRRAVEEPSFEQLEAYARGAASPEVCRQVEAALEASPELRNVVEAMHHPDDGLFRAVDRGIRSARGAWVPWWRRLAVPLAAVTVAMAALLMFRLPSPSDEVEVVPGGLELPVSLRTHEPIRTLKAGDTLPFVLEPPPGTSNAVLLEVGGRTVELVAELGVQPGTPFSSALAMSGDDTISFLVVIFLKEPLRTEVLLQALSLEASREPLLSTVDAPTRERRVTAALRQAGEKLKIDVSSLFQVKPS